MKKITSDLMTKETAADRKKYRSQKKEKLHQLLFLDYDSEPRMNEKMEKYMIRIKCREIMERQSEQHRVLRVRKGYKKRVIRIKHKSLKDLIKYSGYVTRCLILCFWMKNEVQARTRSQESRKQASEIKFLLQVKWRKLKIDRTLSRLEEMNLLSMP